MKAFPPSTLRSVAPWSSLWCVVRQSRQLSLAGLVGLSLLAGCQSTDPSATSSPAILINDTPAAQRFTSSPDTETLPVETFTGGVQTLLSSELGDRMLNRSPQTQHPLAQAAISTVGLGPIQLGMTITEASQVADAEFELAPGDQDRVCQYYFPVDTSLDGLGLMVIEGRIIRIDIWPGSAIQTVSGAQIGMTEAALKALYPGQIEALPHAYTTGKYLTYTANTDGRNLYRIVFETSPEGIVTQYRTGQFPAVTWLEGCS